MQGETAVRVAEAGDGYCLLVLVVALLPVRPPLVPALDFDALARGG